MKRRKKETEQVMTMTQNKNNNKSLFLYTALIFFVAIILIILAFFGQTNLQRSQPSIESPSATQAAAPGITEKASILSEENSKLMQEVSELKEQIASKDETIAGLNTQIESFSIIQENNMLLFHAYESKLADNTDDLKEILSTINYEQLTPEQKTVYDNLNK